jgi:hypothetical protein
MIQDLDFEEVMGEEIKDEELYVSSPKKLPWVITIRRNTYKRYKYELWFTGENCSYLVKHLTYDQWCMEPKFLFRTVIRL